MTFIEAGECVGLQVPLERVFEKPSHDHQLVLWSTAVHLLNLVYNMSWSDECRVQKELAGAQSRLEQTLKEMARWSDGT